MKRAERARALTAAFQRVYPEAHCELNFSGPFELLIATILSAQCTDKRVNIVTKDLFRRHRGPRAFAALSQEQLETEIRSTGFYRNKAKNIRAAAREIFGKHGGKVPDTMEALTALPGVGRKTANVVLGNAFQKEEGIVVDTHVTRLSTRLGLTKQSTPEKIEQDLIRLIPREHWTDFSHWLIWHGRRRCTARKPDCPGCEVQNLCPSAFKAVPRKGKSKTLTSS